MVTAEKALLRIEEAADRLSLGRSKTYELVKAGVIPSVRVGRAVRVPVGALSEWIRDQTRVNDDGNAVA
jgi:excisionase family DNA binding protein